MTTVRGRLLVLALIGVALLCVGWAAMWGLRSFWNPIAFAGMWTGAALVMWLIAEGRGRRSGQGGYPGFAAHLGLALISVPLWWWFELVNARVHNWRYIYEVDYTPVEFGLLSSFAFATAAPAVVAAYTLARGSFRPRGPLTGDGSHETNWRYQLLGGVLLQALVFALPAVFYPFVWVAPLFVVDALLARAGGPSLVDAVLRGRWREPVAIGLAGLLCGFLWEFWNFWSTPRWEYDVPLLGFWKVFEMPLLGYGGYVPFAWFVVQLVRLLSMPRYGSLRRALPGPLP